MSRIINVAHITDDIESNAKRKANGVRATWMAEFYLEAKKDGIDLEPIMRRAIHNIGVRSGKEERAVLCKDKITGRDFGHRFVTRSNPAPFEKETVKDTEDEYIVDFHYCSLVDAWQKMGLDDETCAILCDIAMDGDRGVAEALGLDFQLPCTIARGDGRCRLCFKTKK